MNSGKKNILKNLRLHQELNPDSLLSCQAPKPKPLRQTVFCAWVTLQCNPVHVWVILSNCPIHLIGRKSLHFEKN